MYRTGLVFSLAGISGPLLGGSRSYGGLSVFPAYWLVWGRATCLDPFTPDGKLGTAYICHG